MRPSADLAGRSVALSIDIPAVFDAPLAPHHKRIGRWLAATERAASRHTRHEARRWIESRFDAAVLDILGPIDLTDLRVVAFPGNEDLPPAIAVICDSVGQIDLGWIEKSNVLSNTLTGPVAPVSWRATAYQALVATLRGTFPVFGYDDLVEEIANYYWDGETEDEGARKALGYIRGTDDLDGIILPSDMHARRPDWMLAENAVALRHLPVGLRRRISQLRAAHAAVIGARGAGNAWHFDFHMACDYIDGLEDCSCLPPLTLVSFDAFAQELDDVGRYGMETGFMNVAGLCPLPEAGTIDDWFASLRLGADLLVAAQDLIDFDPTQS